ncbi:MAG: hypothetical protein A2X36_03260 [Elusimicrobia bacterium GWA2_69_24]|nr:MAG: hypothetical protein A2X36_03260 [Elusimicrobia bacterium GWA2_69_24]
MTLGQRNPYAALAVLMTAGILFIPWTGAEAGMLYKKEVSTTWDISEGLRAAEGVYFLSAYRLWNRPGALLRFPDGGRSRTRYGRTLLYRLSPQGDKLVKLTVLEETVLPGNNVKSSHLRRDNGLLRAAFRASNDISSPMTSWRMFTMDLEAGTLIDLNGESDKKSFQDRHFPPAAPKREDTVTIPEMKKLLEKVPFEAWGLPSPLEYAGKSQREYANDLVELSGDPAYRDAIIRDLSAHASPAQIEEIIFRMGRKLTDLKGSARMEYELYGKQTLDRLRGLANR